MFQPVDSASVNRLLNTIERNKSGLSRSLEKIASGRRLGRAGEDAASNAIATRLRSDIGVLTQAVRNVDSGSNFIRSAEGGLATISELVSRGKELSLQAANGTLGDTERQIVNEEFQQIKSEIDRVTGSTEFNGQKLLNGELGAQSATRIDIQAGTGSGPEDRVNLNVIENSDVQSLGLANADISTADGARQAFAALDRAGAQVNATRGEVGATANRLITTANGIGGQIENLTRSESILADTDLAQEISELERGLSLFQTSVRTLAASLQQNEQGTGRLLDFRI